MSDRTAPATRATPPVLVVDSTGDLDELADRLEAVAGVDSVHRVGSVDDARQYLEGESVGCLLVGFDGQDPDVVASLADRVSAPLVAVTDDSTNALEAGADEVLSPTATGPMVRRRLETVLAADRGRTLDTSPRELRESTDRLETRDISRSVMDFGPMVWLALEDGVVVGASPSLEPVCGYTESELVGRQWLSIVENDASIEPSTGPEACTAGEESDDTWTPRQVSIPDRDGNTRAYWLYEMNGHGTNAGGGDRRGGEADRTRIVVLAPASETLEGPQPPAAASSNGSHGGAVDQVLDGERTRSEQGRTGGTHAGDDDVTDLSIDSREIVGALDLFVLVVDRDSGRITEVIGRGGSQFGMTLSAGGAIADVLEGESRSRLESRMASTPTRETPVSVVLETPHGPRPATATVHPLTARRVLVSLRADRQVAAETMTLEGLDRIVTSLERADRPSEIGSTLVRGLFELVPASVVGGYLLRGDRLVPTTVVPSDATPPLSFPPLEVDTVPWLDPRRLSGPAVGVVAMGEFERVLERAGLHSELVYLVPIGDRGLLIATGLGLRSLDTREVGASRLLAFLGRERLRATDNWRRLEAVTANRDRLEQEWERIGDVLEALEASLETESIADEAAVGDALASVLVGCDWIEGVWMGPPPGRPGQGPPWTSAGAAIDPATARSGRNDLADPLDGRPDSSGVIHVPATDRMSGPADSRDERQDRFPLGILVVPIESRNRRWGILTLTVADEAVSDGLQQVLGVVGATLAVAIERISVRTLLVTEDQLALELAVDPGKGDGVNGDHSSPASSDPLLAFARSLETALEVITVTVGDETSTVLCALSEPESGLEPADIVAAGADVSGLEVEPDPVRRGDQLLIEAALETADAGIVGAVGDAGGRLRRIDATGVESRIQVHVPTTIDVRGFLERLETWGPNLELRSKRAACARDRPTIGFGPALRERLTERQLETLRVAYRAGYFEWPRTRSASEVATLLGVSQPTFARHLRVAERHLYELLFDDDWLE